MALLPFTESTDGSCHRRYHGRSWTWHLFVTILILGSLSSHHSVVYGQHLSSQYRFDNQEYEILHARDIYYDSIPRVALQSLLSANDGHVRHDVEQALGGTPQAFCMTLCGNKGKKSSDENINQDRTFVVVSKQEPQHDEYYLQACGVLDGHGEVGHDVSEFGRMEITRGLLAQVELWQTQKASLTPTIVADFMESLLVDVDARVPKKASSRGGATVSFVVRIGSHVYTVNAGDSQSFIAAMITTTTSADADKTDKTPTREVVLLHTTRLDKPDLPSEKERLLEAGAASVTEASDEDDARVWNEWIDEETGQRQSYGLAMSRGIGDRHATGVIANPLTESWSIEDLRRQAKEMIESKRKESASGEGECVVSENGDTETCQTQESVNVDDIELFAVSSTDGILDFSTPDGVVEMIGTYLHHENDPQQVFLAAQQLFYDSAQGWNEAYGGSYRDDMGLSVIALTR